MHPNKHFSFLLLCFLLSALLSACGSRGDLYQVKDADKSQNPTVNQLEPVAKKLKKKPR